MSDERGGTFGRGEEFLKFFSKGMEFTKDLLKENEKLRLSARNLQNHSVLPPEGVNLYDLLRHEHIVLTKGAVEALEARCQ